MRAALLLVLAATPAFAHHPMGGEAPQTFVHGLLSGLAHPVIGVDHLAFVVLVGLAAAASGRLLAGAFAFIAATMIGTALQLAGLALPMSEVVISGSVVALGALLMVGRKLGGVSALVAFAFAGVFHGWAYGEAVIGSTPMPIVAYLIGFGVIQLVIAVGAARLTQIASGQGRQYARIAAAVCMGVGFAFFSETVEKILFAI